MLDLDIDDGMFLSAALKQGDGRVSVRASTLVAAAGGFEANIEWLKQYWGAAADNFLIRGTPNNRSARSRSGATAHAEAPTRRWILWRRVSRGRVAARARTAATAR